VLAGASARSVEASLIQKCREVKTRLIGIVDPFLKGIVHPGQHFWMMLYPNTITSLRHDWTHPAFEPKASVPGIDQVAESERWLHDFAEKVDMSYGTLLESAKNWLERGDYHVFHGYDTPDFCYTDREEMWRHYEIVTGTKVEDSPDHEQSLPQVSVVGIYG
jgi:hypothetical protein